MLHRAKKGGNGLSQPDAISKDGHAGWGHGKILGSGMAGKHAGDIMSKDKGIGTQARFCRL